MTRRTAIWISVAVAVLVLVGAGAGAAVLLLPRPSGPDAAAREYLDALAAGDAERALSRVQEPTDDGVDRIGALAGARELISDPEVVEVDGEVDASSADVAVRYVLGGEQYAGSLALDRVDDRWMITDGALASLDVSSDLGETVAVSDARVPLGAVDVLPARYLVRAAPTDVLVGEIEVTALPDTVRPVALDAELSPAAVELAQAQLDAYARACAAPATEVADACGFVLPWAARLSTLDAVTYRVDALPTLSLSDDGTTFAGTGGDVVATVSGIGLDGAPTTATYRDDDWSLRGFVQIDAETLTLAVR